MVHSTFIFCLFFLITLIGLIKVNGQTYKDVWQSFYACHNGRLQTPIRLNLTESIYNNVFSIVYQDYKSFKAGNFGEYDLKKDYSKRIEVSSGEGGGISFELDGVIKQYDLIGLELYGKMHEVKDEGEATLELHIVHKKKYQVLSNKNQYRMIQDANNYLVIVLRYNKENGISDNGLLEKLKKNGGENEFNLGDYPIFQDKKAYFYQGSFIYNPCNEDVNYIVIAPVFKGGDGSEYSSTTPTKDLAKAYERPIFRNFMNYTESLSSFKINPSKFSMILLFLIFFI